MRVHVQVDNRVRVGLKGLDVDVRRAVEEEFEHRNPEFFLRRAIGKSTFGTPRTIKTWEQDGPWLSLPRGGMARLRNVLEAEGVARKVVDMREEGNGDRAVPDHRVELRPYQHEAVDLLAKREGCILRAPTGCGKTTILFALAARLKVPTLVIVPNRKLMDQWVERAEKEFGLATRDVGIVQSKKRTLRALTVGMQKTVAARGWDDEMRAYFGAVFADEAQLFAARTFFPCVDASPARYRIAVSADHRRKDKKEFLVEDLFGDVAMKIDRKVLEDRGDILDVEVRVVPTDFRAEWYGMPEDEDDEDSSSSERPVDKELDFDRLVKEMAADEHRNAILIDVVLSEARSRQVIVTVHQREHCRVIDQAINARGRRSGFLIGGDDYAKEFVRVKAALLAGAMDVGVGTYKSIGYGIDMPSVGIGVAGTPLANEQSFGQVRGRLCRLSEATGKTDARLYYLWDRHVFGLKALRKIARWNRRVMVLDGLQWVTVKDYLRQARRDARAANI